MHVRAGRILPNEQHGDSELLNPAQNKQCPFPFKNVEPFGNSVCFLFLFLVFHTIFAGVANNVGDNIISISEFVGGIWKPGGEAIKKATGSFVEAEGQIVGSVLAIAG